MKYEIIKLQSTDTEVLVKHNDDGSDTFIPMDKANSDYQAYLKWLEENN